MSTNEFSDTSLHGEGLPPTASAGALYRGMDRATLDAAYDNRRAFPSFMELRDAWSQRGERLLRTTPGERNVRYGPGSRQRLDFLACGIPGRPTLAYIHGGYWQWNDKENYAFVAEGLLAHGVNVAMIEYTLAPQADVGAMILEVQSAMRWLLLNLAGRLDAAPRLLVCGHSAGGHLAATALEVEGLAGALMISGLYDLEPIRLCYLNEALALTENDARSASPVHRVPGTARSVVAVGSGELPELVRQSVDYAGYLREQSREAELQLVPGADHFTILEQLANPRGSLCQRVLSLLREEAGHEPHPIPDRSRPA